MQTQGKDPFMDQQLINRIVEAALLAANQPLTLAQLHALFPEDQPAPPDSVDRRWKPCARAAKTAAWSWSRCRPASASR